MRKAILGVLFSLVLANPAVAAPGLEVSLEDLTLLAESDLSDETILVFLEPRELRFELDPEAIAHLRQQGVSDEVIRYLLKKTDAPKDRDEGVVYVSAGPYPPRYYLPLYAHELFPYFGATILWHWTHGHHRLAHHLAGGHHFGVSARHSSSHGGRHLASRRHRAGRQHARGHSKAGHGARHLGSHRAGHARAGHSGGGHRGGHSGGHGGRGH